MYVVENILPEKEKYAVTSKKRAMKIHNGMLIKKSETEEKSI